MGKKILFEDSIVCKVTNPRLYNLHQDKKKKAEQWDKIHGQGDFDRREKISKHWKNKFNRLYSFRNI